MNLACASCPVRDKAACSVLSIDERNALAKAGRTISLKRGETLFHAGDTNALCATLTSGALKVRSIDQDGSERILALVHPAGFVGEMFRPFADYDVVALGASELCVFSQPAMTEALDAYPSLTKALFRRSQEDLHESRALLELSGKASAARKVATTVASFAQAASDSPCHPAQTFNLPLSRGELADFLGLTIETVSRQLSRLEQDGVIRKNGTRGIDLLDPARLQLVSDQGY